MSLHKILVYHLPQIPKRSHSTAQYLPSFWLPSPSVSRQPDFPDPPLKSTREYKSKITELINQHLKVDIFTYYTSCKVGDFFSLKSSTPHALKANIVYKFECLSVSDTYYIGKTKRHLVTRAIEHTTPKESLKSEVKNHIFGCNECKNGSLSVDQFKVMKQCRNDYSTRIQEAIYIKKFRPKINKQKYSKGESYLLRVF